MRAADPIVIVIGENQPPIVAIPGARRVSRWPSRSIGIAATLLVHLLLTAPLLLGVAAHKQHSSPDGRGTTAWASPGEQSESMILLDLSAMASSEEMDSLRTSPTQSKVTADELLRLLLVATEPSPPPELKTDEDAKDEETAVAAGDPAGQAALFGKYMGQVAARIERAWMRPRALVDGERFQCNVRVIQDRQGNVLSLNLANCDSNDTWRRSLTSAILRASPLSAPPEPWLFSETLSLNFSAEQYAAGHTPEYEYEPQLTRVAASHSDTAESSLKALEADSGDLELTISGSEVRWAKKKASVATSH